MATRTNYTAHTLLHKKFPANVKGYDANEVDKTLDEVIEDYRAFEKYYDDSKAYIAQLEQDVVKKRDEINSLKTENAKLEARMEGIKSGDSSVNRDNIDLIQRMRKLEKELYLRGGDPTKIK